MPAVKKADTAAEERGGGHTSTSGGAGDEPLPLGSKFPGLQPGKVKEAVAALLKYVGAQQESEKALFQEDEMLYLVIALKKTPKTPKNKHKPLRIPLPKPLYTSDGSQVCLIVKDHKGEGHKAAKKRVKETKASNISKVVGVSKLKTKYEAHEAKRALCGEFDLFCADERVLPQLPKLLGKTFFKKKKQPIPVDLTKADWGAQVARACAATYMYPASGSSLSIRVAKSSFSQQECALNVAAAIQGATQHVPRKWAGVQALYLKTSDSVALPVYQTLPSDSNRIKA
mmetsp:Transcript_15882/g.47796  ORF Transcript_15882/g.47796 Transcript_15882/m.47796 type:complete len:285 (+) Transcript_15882:251-1105(+)